MVLERSDVEQVYSDVQNVMEGVPSHHGFSEDGLGHIQLGTEYSLLLAKNEGLDPNLAQVSYLIHDLRWWDGPERRARRIKITGEEGRESGSDILSRLVFAGKISEGEYSEALEAAEKHSTLPSEDPQSLPLTRVVRDADRLTRMGVAGLRSVLEANNFYGNVPFYIEGDEIVRAYNAPIIPFDKINSCITDINSCTGDWVKIMETPTGQTLATILSEVNEEFLRTFSLHPGINEYQIWMDWLGQIKDLMANERLLLRRQLTEDWVDTTEYTRRLIMLEEPELVRAKYFERYLETLF